MMLHQNYSTTILLKKISNYNISPNGQFNFINIRIDIIKINKLKHLVIIIR